MSEETTRLRERHRSVERLAQVTACLIADDMVDARGVTAAMIESYRDLRSAERRLHEELMAALRAQAEEADRAARESADSQTIY